MNQHIYLYIYLGDALRTGYYLRDSNGTKYESLAFMTCDDKFCFDDIIFLVLLTLNDTFCHKMIYLVLMTCDDIFCFDDIR